MLDASKIQSKQDLLAELDNIEEAHKERICEAIREKRDPFADEWVIRFCLAHDHDMLNFYNTCTSISSQINLSKFLKWGFVVFKLIILHWFRMVLFKNKNKTFWYIFKIFKP